MTARPKLYKCISGLYLGSVQMVSTPYSLKVHLWNSLGYKMWVARMGEELRSLGSLESSSQVTWQSVLSMASSNTYLLFLVSNPHGKFSLYSPGFYQHASHSDNCKWHPWPLIVYSCSFTDTQRCPLCTHPPWNYSTCLFTGCWSPHRWTVYFSNKVAQEGSQEGRAWVPA